MLTQLEIRNPAVPQDLMEAFRASGLTYSRALTVYHCVFVNYGQSLVGVFGDGRMGSYEWFIWKDNRLRTSDAGYGNDCAALCCGLIESGVVMANGDHDLLLSWKREGR